MFLVVMNINEKRGEMGAQVKEARSIHNCVSLTCSKFLDILIYELPKELPQYHDVDHKLKLC
jgi:hypothetical protein